MWSFFPNIEKFIIFSTKWINFHRVNKHKKRDALIENCFAYFVLQWIFWSSFVNGHEYWYVNWYSIFSLELLKKTTHDLRCLFLYMNPQRMLYIVGAIHSLKKLYKKFWDAHYLKKKPKTTWFCIFMLVSLILWYDFERLRKSGLFRYRPCLSFLFLTYERHKYQHLTVIPIFLRQWHFSQKNPSRPP